MAATSTQLLRRLNPYCAQALGAAASLCQHRGHADITVEHWLLKLLEQGDGDLPLIARRYEWDMDVLWQGLLEHLSSLPRSVQAKPPLSGNLQQLIQHAWLRASLGEDCDTLRSVHVLSALVQCPGLIRCEAAWPLLSVSQGELEAVLAAIDSVSAEGTTAAQVARLEAALLPAPGGHNAADDLTVLDQYTHDLVAKAHAGQIDPVYGRDDEIRQVIDILSRRRKNNPILVGDPGVGKTALVEGLALRIAHGDVPRSLKHNGLRSLDLGLLQAGAGVKGEFERRLKQVIDAVQHAPAPILLFIDEAHTLIGAGNPAGGADAANLLKPALARGELRTLAATTWAEYKQYFERDAALERRFQLVRVEEPNDAAACLMLRGLKNRYASHHGVHVEDAAIEVAVGLSRRYLTGRQLPDKAVDVLDTACARVRMGLDCEPHALVRLKSQHDALALERAALEQDQTVGVAQHGARIERIAARQYDLHTQCLNLQAHYRHEREALLPLLAARQAGEQDEAAELRQRLSQAQGECPLLSLDVTSHSVAEVVADWTGIPLGNLLKNEQTHLLALESQLGERVVGQDGALKALAKRLRAAKAGLTNELAPLGVFLLVGPSGVGKTETAHALAATLFGGEHALITLNLSEYQESHNISQLKGSPPGYVGYGRGGVLTEAVRQRPYSVVLLDEVEKAHRDVLELFYQVFDRGWMRDGEGREIDFRNTVILMTSNLGSDALQAFLQQQPGASDDDLHEWLRPSVREHFQPALLARFQTLIYRPLGAEALARIVALKLETLAGRLQRHYGLACDYSPSLSQALAAACLLPDSGARNIDSLLDQQILPVMSEQLLRHQAAGMQAQRVVLGYGEEEGVTLAFTGSELGGCA